MPTIKPPAGSAIQSREDMQTVDVALLLHTGFNIGEVAAFADALCLANRLGQAAHFNWTVCGLEDGSVESSSGIKLDCSSVFALKRSGLNLIVMGPSPKQRPVRAQVASVLRFVIRHNGFVGAIGPSVEMLADLGLLDGKQASAHWEERQTLRDGYPRVEFTDNIFFSGKSLGTCAGATATADFAVDFISRFTDEPFAEDLARKLKCQQPRRGAERLQRESRFSRFPGAPAQFLRALELVERDDVEWLELSDVVSASGVSPRQLQRLFKRYLKLTPRECLQIRRLRRARELLTRTAMTITAVAGAAGFESPTHFTRRYQQAYGVTPSEARRVTWSSMLR